MHILYNYRSFSKGYAFTGAVISLTYIGITCKLDLVCRNSSVGRAVDL